jgi:hypothetical protein
MAATADTAQEAPAPAAPAPEDVLREAAKEWLQRRGVPHFTGKPENRRVHAIYVTAFVVVYTVVFGVLVAEASPLATYAALGPAFVLVALAVVVAYRTLAPKHEKPLPPPSWMNVILAVSVVIGPVLDAIETNEVRDPSVALVAIGLLVVLVVAATTPLGAVHVLLWALRHPFREARHTAMVLAGAIPFLLLTLAFLLLTNELWVVAPRLDNLRYFGTLGMFALLGLALFWFEALQMENAARFADWKAVRRAIRAPDIEPPASIDALVDDCLKQRDELATTDVRDWLVARMKALDGADDKTDPVRAGKLRAKEKRNVEEQLELLLVSEWKGLVPEDTKGVRKLGHLERWNLVMVVAYALSIQVLAVGVAMGMFFLLFGWATVDRATLGEQWDVDWQEGFLWLTAPHWEVAGLLAAFAGLTYAVSVSLSKDHRALFLGELDRKVKQRLAVRALYQALK